MKRLFVLTFTALTVAWTCMAADLDYPCQKLINKGEFSKAHKEMATLLQKKPDDLSVLYGAACLFSEPTNPNQDLAQAYRHSCKGLDIAKNRQDKETVKLRQKGYVTSLFQSAIDRCTQLATEDAQKTDRPEDYRAVRTKYVLCSKTVREQLLQLEELAAYRLASETNTIEAYEAFIKAYPDTRSATKARYQIHEQAYQTLRRYDSRRACADYLNKYPNSHRCLEVLDRLYPGTYREEGMNEVLAPIYMSVCKVEDDDDAVQALLNQRTLMRYIVRTKNYNLAHEGFGKFAPPMRDSCWLVLHEIYTSYNNTNNFKSLYERYPTENFPEHWRKDSAVIAVAGSADAVNFIRTTAPYRVAYVKLIESITEYMNKGKWDDALAYAQQFSDAFGDDRNYQALLEILAAPIDKTLVKQRLSDKINSKNGHEFAPIPSMDGQSLYFCGKYRKDNVGGEDIFISRKNKKGQWEKAELVLPLSTRKGNEAPEAVSADGSEMILFKGGSLYSSRKRNGAWGEPKALPKNIHISDWQADVSLTSNGKAMLFTAETQLPYQASKSQNIYVTLLDSAGNWSKPIDLGPTINTNRDDRMPFIHPDMQTLYFSSEGHGGIGGMDVYKSTRLNPNSWTEWSEPVNLGKQVNTTDDDWGYKISTDGSTAYFSGDDDIFMMNLPENMRPKPVVCITGLVTDNTGKAAKVVVTWHNTDIDTDAGKIQISADDGSYFYVLQPGYSYSYTVDDVNYHPFTGTIDLRNITTNTDKEVNIRLTPYKEKNAGALKRQAAED